MTHIKIEIPIRFFKEKKADTAKDFFSDITIPWTFCQKETLFTSSVCVNKKLKSTYKHELTRIKELIKLFSRNEKLKAELMKCKERAKNDWMYDLIVTFNGDIAAEIDISENSILHYKGPISKDITSQDISKLKKLIVSEMLDDFYETKIKKFLMSIIMIFMLADPSITLGCGNCNLFIDTNKYKSETFYHLAEAHGSFC